ncbi:MAG: hypothetical protein Ct9H300mP12_13620 [Acidimicrobiales bacterium]|nr:MAG: hypothetical protein Ct9H300mP12_13620 [Acidimicrobiales bacterium]
MLGDPALWNDLMERLVDMAITSLRSQIAPGPRPSSSSTAGLGPSAPRSTSAASCLTARGVFEGVADTCVPRIHFGVGTGEILPLMAKAGADVGLGVDWRVPLDEARRRLGPDTILQGNLDPAVCLGPPEVVEAEVADVLSRNGRHPGHVFNLGHGVLPETNPAVLEQVVAQVHAYSIGG